MDFNKIGAQISQGLQSIPGKLTNLYEKIVDFMKNPNPPVPKQNDVRAHMNNQPPVSTGVKSGMVESRGNIVHIERPPLPENTSKFNFKISADPSGHLEQQLITLANTRTETSSFIAQIGKEIHFSHYGQLSSEKNSIAKISINEEGKFYIALKGDRGGTEVTLDGVKLNRDFGGNFVLEAGIQHKFQIGDKTYEFKIEDMQR